MITVVGFLLQISERGIGQLTGWKKRKVRCLLIYFARAWKTDRISVLPCSKAQVLVSELLSAVEQGAGCSCPVAGGQLGGWLSDEHQSPRCRQWCSGLVSVCMPPPVKVAELGCADRGEENISWPWLQGGISVRPWWQPLASWAESACCWQRAAPACFVGSALYWGDRGVGLAARSTGGVVQLCVEWGCWHHGRGKLLCPGHTAGVQVAAALLAAAKCVSGSRRSAGIDSIWGPVSEELL